MKNHRELVDSLAGMSPEQVKSLVGAADATRTANGLLESLSEGKKRRKRGPNKPKPEVAIAPPAAPVKKSHHKAKPAAAPFVSALERLKAKKDPGLKVRTQRRVNDEE